MRKRQFTVGTIYNLDLTGPIQFGPIQEQVLWQKFTDGRIFGLMGATLVAGSGVFIAWREYKLANTN